MAANVDRHDLAERLAEQVQFLVASAKSFDAGFEGEGRRLATTIRLLMHDTGRSHSLLGMMHLKESMLFYDSSFRYSSRNLGPESGLAVMKIRITEDGTRGQYVPSLSRPPERAVWRGPRRWWQGDHVIRDQCGEHFTRRELVLCVADNDGGAHVDPKLDPRYEALTRGHSMGFKVLTGGAELDFDNGPALASVRMIAHEILLSIQHKVPMAMGAVQVHEFALAPDVPESVWGR